VRSLSQLLVAALALISQGAAYRSPNFVVLAPSPALAQQVAAYAEYHRREKALLWLGRELPTWPRPCLLRVTLSWAGSGGSTTFDYQGLQDMRLMGQPGELIVNVLPHEVTHTVLATHFGGPVPRWADEGAAVLSEGPRVQAEQDALARQALRTGRAYRLRTLFRMDEYPRDAVILYAQGYSVARFLVLVGGRPRFLYFVGLARYGDWDRALQASYGCGSVEALEQAWIAHLRAGR
jgi:hypothetical protein